MQTAQENATNHALRTVSAAAAYLGLPPHEIYRAIKEGAHIGEKQGGKWQLAQSALDAYYQSRGLISEPSTLDVDLTTAETSEEPINTSLELVPVTQPMQTTPQTTKTVQLQSGGFLTFSYSVDLFEADKPELDMLLSIVATIKNYEATQGTSYVQP